MKIPVPHMTHDGGGKREVDQIIPGFGDALRETGNWNADVRRQHFGAGPQGAAREIGLMTRTP